MKDLRFPTKIKYHASKSTDLEPSVIIEKILAKLNTKKYRITNVTNNEVTFDDWRVLFVSRVKALRRLDGGKFEISTSDNGTMVNFSYHLNFLPLLLVIGALMASLAYDGDYGGVIFFGVFYAIAGFVQNIATKDAGKAMLSVILTGEYP
ncbi:MAG: hypothetical protein ACHQIM_09705 [Sphingobacteriales bacterium]